MLGVGVSWHDAAAAALLASVLFWTTGKRRPALLLVVALLPVAVVYAWNPDNRVYSYHGFFHLSVVYQMFEGGLPVGNPVLAGTELRFNWGPHAVVAAAARWLGAPPAWTFAFLNCAALVVTVVFLFKLGLRLVGEQRAAAFGVAVAIFAFSVTQLASRLPVGRDWLEAAGVPLAAKFTNLTAMPMGVACFAVFVHGIGRIVEGRRPGGACGLLAGSLAAAIFLYPIGAFGMVAGGATALLALLLWREPVPLRRLLAAALAGGAGCLVALPYVLSMGMGAAQEPALRLSSLYHVLVYAANYAVLALPAAALLLVARKGVGERVRGDRALFIAIGGVVLGNALVSIFTQGPVWGGIEYKFRALSFVPVGLVAGLGVEALRRRSGVAAFLVITGLLVPFANDLRFKLTRGGVIDPYFEDGSGLRHASREQDEMYAWILRETSPRAAFVDSTLAIPVFARRPLFVGLNSRKSRIAPGRYHDGWLLDPETQLAELVGGSGGEVAARSRTARAVLAGEDLDEAAQRLATLAREAGLEDLYVVVREPAVATRLDAHAAFLRIFGNDAAAVFRFEPR